MLRDHVGFSIFLCCLLIAPKIPLNIAGVPEKTGISLGVVGLLSWGLMSPLQAFSIRRRFYSAPSVGLVMFGFYAVLISLVSFNLISIAYSVQYLIYLILTYTLVSEYMKRSIALRQFSVTTAIIAVVGMVFTIGVIISLVTGPIYPHQTLDTARIWGGLFIQQGVGFAESTNSAGAFMITFCAFFLFAYRQASKIAWIFCLFSIVALFGTISRSSIGSFFLALIGLLSIVTFRVVLCGKISKLAFGFVGMMLIMLTLTIGATSIFLSTNENPQIMEAISAGVGVSTTDILKEDAEFRVELWKHGVRTWSDGSVREQFLGKGFRRSIQFTESEAAWLTPHNTYLMMLGDFGFVGLLLFLLPIVVFLTRVISHMLSYGCSLVSQFAFVSIVGLLLHSMTEGFFYSPNIISLILVIILATELQNYKDSLLRLG